MSKETLEALRYWIYMDYQCYLALVEDGSIDPKADLFRPTYSDGTPVPEEIWRDLVR